MQALTLERDAFHALLGRLDSLRSMWRFEALQRVPLFARIDAKTKAAVAAALGQVSMPGGTAVVTQVSTAEGSDAPRGTPRSRRGPAQGCAAVPHVCAHCRASASHAPRSQGERGQAFYIVESGQLSAFKDSANQPVMSYGPGQ